MEFPKGGLIGRIVHGARSLGQLQIPLHAAHACYFIVLSLFPALVMLLSLLRYTSLEVGSLLGLLQGIVPAALLPEAEYLVISTYQSTTGAMVGLSALTALWSASRGIYGLLKGLNAVYGTAESRGWLYTRCISVGYTFAFLLVLLLTLVLHVFGTGLARWLSRCSSPLLRFLTGAVDLRMFVLLFLQTALFTAMYSVFPNKPIPAGRCIPGALLSAVGWQVFSHLFSVYVEHFPTYSNIYGSVYAVALSMLWLYLSIVIVFYGGLLNRWLQTDGG